CGCFIVPELHDAERSIRREGHDWCLAAVLPREAQRDALPEEDESGLIEYLDQRRSGGGQRDAEHSERLSGLLDPSLDVLRCAKAGTGAVQEEVAFLERVRDCFLTLEDDALREGLAQQFLGSVLEIAGPQAHLRFRNVLPEQL